MGILGELWVKLGLKNEDFKKGVQDSKKQANGLAAYMTKLGGSIAAAFSVKAIVNFSKEAANLNNQAKGVKEAFDRLGDPTLLASLRKATQGTVDDLQLMQRAVQAKNFNIPLSQLATYLQFATKRARETGESVDYLVNSIITGLGRESKLILDNLGISAAELKERMADGASMADAVGEIIKKSMGDGAVEIDKATTATESFTAAWKNFQIAFGEGVAPIWNTLYSEAAGVLDMMTRVMNAEGFSFWEKLGMVFGGVNADENREKLLNQEKARQEKENAAMQSAKAQVEAIKTLEDAYKELKILEQDRLKLAGKPEDDPFVLRNKYALQYLKEYIENEEKEAKSVKSLVQQLEDEIEKKESIRDLSANKVEVEKLNAEIEKLKEKLKLLKMSNDEQKKYWAQKLKERNARDEKKWIDKKDSRANHIALFDEKFLEKNAKNGKTIMDKAYNQYLLKQQQMAEKALEQQQMLDQMNAHFNNSIVAGISNGIDELVRAMFSIEGADWSNVLQALLTPMADALASAGEMIIAEGIAVEAFKDSLKNLQGAPAIAAGAAMVAIASAVKAGLQAIGSNPTAAGGYGASAVTSYSGGYGVNTANYSQSNDYSLTTTLKGQDLLLAIKRTENNNKR